MEQLEKRIGYKFKNKKILERALTHSSYSSHINDNYERLEFLGDRILGVTIAQYLYDIFPNEPEGNLSVRFVSLVCKETVSEVSRQIGLQNYIITATPDIKDTVNILCDVGEALIAAIYKDSGDMNEAQKFIKLYWSSHIDKSSKPQKDYKTTLQEQVYIKGFEAPIYTLVKKSGSEHQPIFLTQVQVGKHTSTGEVKTKN